MLAFIDESGHPHPNDSNPLSTLVAVCMPEREHRGISRRLYSTRRTLFGPGYDLELKAKNLINQRTFNRIPEKRELVERAFEIIRSSPITIFCITIPRPSREIDVPQDHLPYQHYYLFQRINALAEAIDDEALIVYDGEFNTQGRDMSSCISSYIFKVAEYYGTLNRLVDTALFVDSRVTPGIQLADLAAGAIRLHEQHRMLSPGGGHDLFQSAVTRWHNAARSKTRDDLTDDHENPLYGFWRLREQLLYRRQALPGATPVGIDPEASTIDIPPPVEAEDQEGVAETGEPP
jgi:hypothetical protein